MSREGEKTHTHTSHQDFPKGCEQNNTPENPSPNKNQKKGYVTPTTTQHNRWLRWLRFTIWTSQQHDSHDDTSVLMTSSRASDNKRRKSSSIRMETANLGGLQGYRGSKNHFNSCAKFIFVRRKEDVLEIQFDLNVNVPYIYIYISVSLNLSMVTLLVPDHHTDQSLTASQRNNHPVVLLASWNKWTSSKSTNKHNSQVLQKPTCHDFLKKIWDIYKCGFQLTCSSMAATFNTSRNWVFPFSVTKPFS